MAKKLIAAVACVCLGCSWAWTQLSGGGGARCTQAQAFVRSCAAENQRLRVSLIDGSRRQELTLLIDAVPERTVAVGLNAFGAKQFEVVREEGGTQTRIFFGGLFLHPEELLRFAGNQYPISCGVEPVEPSVPVHAELCGYQVTFRSLARSESQ